MHIVVRFPHEVGANISITEHYINAQKTYTCCTREIPRTAKKHIQILHFRGYAVTDEQLILSRAGIEQLIQSKGVDGLMNAEGAFTAIVSVHDEIFAFTDRFGFEQLFYTDNHDGSTIISSSFHLLIEAKVKIERRVKIDREICEAYLLRMDITDQLFSRRTLVSGVFLLSYQRSLCLTPGGVTVELESWKNRHFESNYSSLLRKGAERILQKIDVMSRLSESLVVSLSGGLDSRVTYSLSKLVPLKNLYLLSGGADKDRQIAHQVAKLYDDQPHGRLPRRRVLSLDPATALRRWEFTHLGVYSFLEVSQTLYIDPFAAIELRGGCGGPLKTFFDNMESEFARVDNLNLRKLPELLKEDLPDLPSAHSTLDWRDRQYLGYRNRIHFGRTMAECSRSILRFDPLMTPDLLSAAALTPREWRQAGQIHCDLLLLVNPMLAFMPFDDSKKSFSKEVLMRSPFLGERNQLEFQPLEIIGNPADFSAFEASEINGDQSWMKEDDFRLAVSQKMTATIGAYCPKDLKVRSKTVTDALEVGNFIPADWHRVGRQVSKYFAVSRLIEIGVEW